MIKFQEFPYTHYDITNIDYNYDVLYSYFSYCYSYSFGGAINCNHQLKHNKLNVLFSNFFQCSAETYGGSIYSNISTYILCTIINNCHVGNIEESAGSASFYQYNTKISSCSFNECSGFSASLIFFGSLSDIQYLNQSSHEATCQTAGFSIKCDKISAKFLTFVNLYDKDGCTMTLKCPQPSELKFLNIFNCSSSSEAKFGLFLFSNGVNTVICIKSENCHFFSNIF